MRFKVDENLPVEVTEVLRQHQHPSEDYQGIIVLCPAVQNLTSVIRMMNRVVQLLGREPLEGHLWIVDDHKVRVRAGQSGAP